ncbi:MULTISPECIES: hypothetical protein [unclassified Mycobacterium]|uniref:hypothetical protein n=1 Tax=unclassified Mycobacterium TaxID=2642494 RepID=UPI0029C7F917|nr:MULTISPECIES: hypothetical protein [unclassified Mycobacterium]
MRFVATLLFWLITTAALAVAVPTMWAQHTIVDRNGYSAFAASAAKDPNLQQAMAAELTSQLVMLAANSGFDVNENLFSGAATAYTRSSAFPGQFALANQLVHRYMFTEAVQQTDSSGRWQLDLSPMLSDSSFKQTLQDFGIQPPSTLTIPLTENVSESLRPGQLRQATKWGPWVSVGSAIVAGVFALLTIAAAKKRGKALAALGVSALLVGASGWAAIEVLRGRINQGLDATNGDIRQLAAAMVDHAIGSLHFWLNLTLAAGAGLVLLGVLAAMLGGLGRRRVIEPVER